MYQHGRAYRYHPPTGKKIYLGRDLTEALRRYYLLTGKEAPEADPLRAQTIWDRHRRGAKQRGIEFEVTVEEIQKILDDQGDICAITGLHFRMEKPAGLRFRPWAPSLDRINSRTGYVAGNVRVVCGFVNIAMNGFGEQFFALVLQPLIEAGIKAEKWLDKHP